MEVRGLTLAVLAYLCLDFANPMIPGAVSFEPDESVEGVWGDRGRCDAAALRPPPALASVQVEPPPGLPAARPRRLVPSTRPERPGHLGRSRLTPSDTAASADDH